MSPNRPVAKGSNRRITVNCSCGDVYDVAVEVPEAEGAHGKGGWKVPEPEERPAGVLPHWLWLSERGLRIMEAVKVHEWTTAEEIARQIGENYGPEFRGVLKDMTDRGMLTSCQGKGYRMCVTPPEGPR